MSSSSTSVKSKMPAKKSDASKIATPVSVVVTAAPAAPVVQKAKKEKKPAAPSAAAVVEVVESSDVILAGLAEKLKSLSTELTTRVREATKSVSDAIKATKREAREIKNKKKKNPADMTPEERKTWEARRANNAFLVQRPLTDELCSFMGLKSGDKRSQTEVTKFISGYVKQHNCFDPNFKRRILPNSALAKLLRVSDKDEVTYLNLQSFLKVHFIKPKA
jgi:chromatin remodeling complex protein RSC6